MIISEYPTGQQVIKSAILHALLDEEVIEILTDEGVILEDADTDGAQDDLWYLTQPDSFDHLDAPSDGYYEMAHSVNVVYSLFHEHPKHPEWQIIADEVADAWDTRWERSGFKTTGHWNAL